MKKSYLLAFVLFLSCFLIANAQNKISFTESNSKSEALTGKFKSYKILEINDNLERISDGQQITISLDQDYSFTLKENRILAADYVVSIKDKKGIIRKTLEEIDFDGKYFMNEMISSNSQLVFSMFENSYSFYIKSATKEFYIEPLKNTDRFATSNQYVYYEVKDIIQNEPYNCGVKEESDKTKTPNQLEKNTVTGGCKTVNINFYVDYTMYETYGNINAAINRTLEILNLTQANYTIANELLDDVSFKVSEHCIVTCDSCNNWPPTLEIGDNFYGLYNNVGLYNFQNPLGKIKVLFQNEGGTGVVAGLANLFQCGYIDGCTVVKNFVADSDLTRNILSHELGHNLGCVHTTGFIMNYFANGSTTWAPESITTINNTVNTLLCITDCAVLPCDEKKVVDIVITPNTVTDQITISWLSEPGMVYKMKLQNLSTYALADYSTVSYPANSISYPITQTYCNDRYKFVITPQCNGTDGITENALFNVSQDVASPTLKNWTGFRDYFSSFSQSYPNLCNGNTYYCSITGIDGGTAPVYQWKVNGINVGTNSNTLTINTLQNNDVLSCEFTSNATCVASPTALFSTVVSVVNPVPLFIMLEEQSSTTVCARESITINQTININSDYQFDLTLLSYFNGYPIDFLQVGLSDFSRIFTFTPSESGVFYCGITIGTGGDGTIPGCYTNQEAYSNPINITVLPQPCNLAVSDFDISGLKYFPNPVKNNFTISSKIIIENITITSVLGQEILRKSVNDLQTEIDLSSFANGIYFVKVTAIEQEKLVKIIKE